MEENKKKLSIYLKKSVSKADSDLKKADPTKIAVTKLVNNNVSPNPFYKPITRIINIEPDVS